jgi:hypothetical protein
MPKKYTRFRDIEQLTEQGSYNVDIPLEFLEKQVKSYIDTGLDLNPDFQRGHVWSQEQQMLFVEYLLRGGKEQSTIFLNHTKGRVGASQGEFVIVDGLQRLTACRLFLANKLPVFGSLCVGSPGLYFSEFTDSLLPHMQLRFNINNLPTRKAVLQWYLEINSGATPHTNCELDRVRGLLAAEG